MRIPSELDGARLNLRRAAELITMHPAHFRRLIRKGVFPDPKRTPKGMPYFDHGLLLQVAEVLRTGVGRNGEEICFYERRRRATTSRRTRRSNQQPTGEAADAYLAALIDGLRQLGVEAERLSPDAVAAALRSDFGGERPAIETVLPVVARRILRQP